MNALTPGALMVIVGLALCLIAWSFFRLDEHKFLTFAPFSEAHRYMRKPGGIMWWIGIVLLVLGIFKYWNET